MGSFWWEPEAWVCDSVAWHHSERVGGTMLRAVMWCGVHKSADQTGWLDSWARCCFPWRRSSARCNAPCDGLCFTGSCTAVRVQGVDIIIKVFYFYVLSMSVGVHVYVPCKCLVLLWSSSRYWIPWNWSYNGSVVSQYMDAVNSTGALWRSKCHYPLSHHSSSLMVLFLISIMLKIYQTFALNSHPTVEESNVSLYYTWGKGCIKAWLLCSCVSK